MDHPTVDKKPAPADLPRPYWAPPPSDYHHAMIVFELGREPSPRHIRMCFTLSGGDQERSLELAAKLWIAGATYLQLAISCKAHGHPFQDHRWEARRERPKRAVPYLGSTVLPRAPTADWRVAGDGLSIVDRRVLGALDQESRCVPGAPQTSGTYVAPELLAAVAGVSHSSARSILRLLVRAGLARGNGPIGRGKKYRITEEGVRRLKLGGAR